MDEKIKEATRHYRKKFGLLPIDEGYVFNDIIDGEVCFARTKEAIEAYKRGEIILKRHMKLLDKFMNMFLFGFIFLIVILIASAFIFDKVTAIVDATLIALFILFVLASYLYDKVARSQYKDEERIWQRKLVIVRKFGLIEKL